MKKLTTLSIIILLFIISGCGKTDIDIGSNKNNSTVINNNTGTSPGNLTDPPVDSSLLNVITRMNNKTMFDGETYYVGARTLIEFNWDRLPSTCNSVKLTIVMSDTKTGDKLYEDSFHTNAPFYIVEIPTNCFYHPHKTLVQWKVEPKTCSGKHPVEGKWYFTK